MCESFIILFFLAVEDIKLNSTVFHWPGHISTVFELSNNRIQSKRESLEEDLRKRILAFEDRLSDFMKEVESFKKKEVSYIWLNTFKFTGMRALYGCLFFSLVLFAVSYLSPTSTLSHTKANAHHHYHCKYPSHH